MLFTLLECVTIHVLLRKKKNYCMFFKIFHLLLFTYQLMCHGLSCQDSPSTARIQVLDGITLYLIKEKRKRRRQGIKFMGKDQ